MARDLVLFLGAGFSRAAGVPIMKEFGDASRREYRNLVKRHGTLNPKTPGYRCGAAQLIDAAETYEAFRTLCETSQSRKTEDWENIETVFSVAEALDEASPDPVLLRNSEFSTAALVRDIQLWIWKVYHVTPLVQSKPDVPVDPKPYQVLFDGLRNRNLAARTAVITTNYDILFEWLAWGAGVPCSYPVSPGEDVSVNQLNPEPYVFPASENVGVIPICKLHGSVNYFETAEDGGQRRLRVSRDLGGGSRVGGSGTYRGKPALLALDALWTLQKRYGGEITPAIVPPSYAKLGRRNWLREIWAEAYRALAAARTIIFIGYSLPPSDGFMAALLSAAAAGRGGAGVPSVHVIDPCEASLRAIEAVHVGGNVNWIPKTFSQAAGGAMQGVLDTLV